MHWISELIDRTKTKIPKYRDQKIVEHIERELRIATDKASSDIRIGIRVKINEANQKGTLRSGSFVTVTLNFVVHTVTESCKNLLNIIEVLQNKWNIAISDKTLDIVAELINKRYQGLIDSVICNDFEKVISLTKPPSRSTDLQINLLRQSIPNIVSGKIKEIKTNNKLTVDAPGVRVAKRANKIALLALLVAIASFYYTATK